MANEKIFLFDGVISAASIIDVQVEDLLEKQKGQTAKSIKPHTLIKFSHTFKWKQCNIYWPSKVSHLNIILLMQNLCFALFHFSAQKRTNGLRRNPRQVDPGVFVITGL